MGLAKAVLSFKENTGNTTVACLSRIAGICFDQVDCFAESDQSDLACLCCYLTSGENTDLHQREKAGDALEIGKYTTYDGVLKTLLFCAQWKSLDRFLQKQFVSVRRAQGPLPALAKVSTSLGQHSQFTSVMTVEDTAALDTSSCASAS